ncbi:methyl-accepting chemotaxis sensory transducer [Rhizobium terrae]|uniref:methyl-accepting chemotaxis sensory transducer n=1 Tax=Rhizobium terrae TaxID=2171756 RepID=UPI000E3EB2C0|nr:methyl-accepting chemotaxis sensory transducer [Rhizobium terrae]
MAVRASIFDIAQGSPGVLPVVDRLETARSRIEERFLEGGAALLSILDVLNKLIASLDQLTGSLDEGTANATMAELTSTVDRLSRLTRIETERQAGFQEIACAERKLEPEIEEMQETLRYLRTFAVTAKITGAGIADFSGFAEEILERIQEGTRQVNDFAGKLSTLGHGLGPVMTKGKAILASYNETVPQIVAGLSKGAAEIGKHRKLLGERAAKVRSVAGGIQTKLASTLSAMQVGDITRQRIEHCQSSLQILSEYLESPAGSALDTGQRESLSLIIRQLVSLQLNQSIADFDRDTAKIVATVASFRSDLAQIEALRGAMTEGDDESDNAIRQLENGVAAARVAVREIEDVASQAGALSHSTVTIVRELLDGIGIVRAVRTDIHYMALNTNLRCGKIGEEGKAINVVTAELRNFAGKLDETAEEILAQLQTLETAANKLVGVQGEENEESLDSRLEHAVENIRAVGDRMDAQMAGLRDQSKTAVSEMDISLARLNFNAELGEVLRTCAGEMEIGEDVFEAPGLEEVLADIGGRIGRLYTMVAERELHAAVMGTQPPVEAAAVATVMSDEDIEDALF